jgi:hypothetical protein
LYCVTCFFIVKSGEVGWVSHPAVEGRKLLRWSTTKAEGQPLNKAEAGIKRWRASALDPEADHRCVRALSAHAPTRRQSSSAYVGLQIEPSPEPPSPKNSCEAHAPSVPSLGFRLCEFSVLQRLAWPSAQ